jgi:hypothetical protein
VIWAADDCRVGLVHGLCRSSSTNMTKVSNSNYLLFNTVLIYYCCLLPIYRSSVSLSLTIICVSDVWSMYGCHRRVEKKEKVSGCTLQCLPVG